MSNQALALYLRDLGVLIEEKALQAKSDYTLADNSNKSDYAYKMGQLMAFHEIVSLMKDQADNFGVSQVDIGLEKIDPDTDLL